ncbi:MAG: aldo/keto reductase family oxidoreductase [Clostridia bacterium]|nr:aldo/keto reductase family oxidoreductase [Clostridia bacterium]
MDKFIQGCMRIKDMTASEVRELIDANLEVGINVFDHADIYGGGECETLFGKALKEAPQLRDKIVLQTKGGIVKDLSCHRYDNSANYLIDCAHKSIKRLGVEKIDRFLIHRPDALFNPDDVAKAFDTLTSEGVVEEFGVSNFSGSQIELLQSGCKQKLLYNQIRVSLFHCPMIEYGMNYNRYYDAGVNRDGGTLDYCRLNGVQIQCYSPYKGNKKSFIGDIKYPKLNKLLKELAFKYDVTPNAIVASWLFKHPAGFAVINGTTKPERVKQIAKAKDVTLTRSEWYALYHSLGRKLP